MKPIAFVPLCLLIACSEPTPNSPTANQANQQTEKSLLPEKSIVASSQTQPENNRASHKAEFAKQAVQLLFKGCVTQTADVDKIAQFANQNKFLELTAEQKAQYHFEAETKRVWGLHTRNGGQFYLAAGTGFCAVKARFADSHTVQQEAERMLQLVATQTQLTLKSNFVASPNSDITQIMYTLSSHNAPGQWLFFVQSNQTEKTGLQASLNMRIVAK